MRTRSFLLPLVLLLITPAVQLLADQTPRVPAKIFSNNPKVHTATRLLKIDYNSLAVPGERIDPILTSHALKMAAAKKAFRKPAAAQLILDYSESRDETRFTSDETFFDHITGERKAQSGMGNRIIETITIIAAAAPTDDEQPSLKYLESLTEEMSRLLEQLNAQFKAKTEQEVKEAATRLAEATDKLTQLQAKHRQLLTSTLPREVILETLSSLQRQKQALQLDLVGYEARLSAIQQQADQVHARINTQAKDDPILEDLAKIVAQRQEELNNETALYKAGTVERTRVAEAQEKVLLANIELARARKAAGGQNSTMQLDKFNADLMAVAIDTSTAKARLAFIEKELKAMMEQSEQQLAVQAEIDNMASKLDGAKQDVKLTTGNLNYQRSKLATIRPMTAELIEPTEGVLDLLNGPVSEFGGFGGGGFQ